MRLLKLCIVFCVMFSCKNKTDERLNLSEKTIKKSINNTINNWHKAAAQANYNNYFSLMTKEAVFIGTDATENWKIQAFKNFSKPYFDKGKAWHFTPLERNIYLYEDKKMAWFDELLDTQMKVCRGSGVIKLEDGKWKIAHYVLSIAIPNKNVTEVVKQKQTTDSLLILKLKNKTKQTP